jgi:hypothetical protein
MIKLGKLPARIDARTFKLSSILKKILPPVPDSYDFDKAFPQLTFPYGNAYGNIEHGDCVEVAKYMHQVRAEAVEQGIVLPITEKDVLDQYFSETGSKEKDNGLVMLDSLNQWRNTGIKVGGKKLACLSVGGVRYKIRAFAQISAPELDEIKASIYLLYGMFTGLMLPLTAQDQTGAGKVWEIVDEPGSEFGSWGGHGVDTIAYEPQNSKTDKYYLECFTWGKRQVMTYDFFKKYSDEDYAIADAKDRANSPIDEEKLNGYLAEIA